MAIEFRPSPAFSVGLELEFQLVDKKTKDLVDGIIPLKTRYLGNPLIRPELTQNTVEIGSTPSEHLAETEEQMLSLAAEVVGRADDLGMQLSGAGTHPFCRRLAEITPEPRYLMVNEANGGFVPRHHTVLATQVHIGLNSGEEALAVMRRLKLYLPILIALAANSPFWGGHDTGFASYRHRLLAPRRSYGVPPSFSEWSDFEQFFGTLQRAGLFETISDVHWDIRPRPHLGTVEVRVMDSQPTIAEALSLASFIRSLTMLIKETTEDDPGLPIRPLPWWALKDNCHLASRFGRAASIIVDPSGRVAPLHEVAKRTLDLLLPFADSLGERSYLEPLDQVLEGTAPYERQRCVFAATQSFEEVVNSTTSELLSELEGASHSPRTTSVRSVATTISP